MNQQSSLIADLKRFGGPIRAIKVEVEPTQPIKRQERPTETAPQTVIKDIAAKILPPFVVIEDSQGIVHDSTTIAVKCGVGHIHKYLLKNIQAAGLTKCLTCHAGNQFSTMARESIENILGTPFVKADGAKGEDISFGNPVLKIKLICPRAAGIDDCFLNDGIFSVKIHKTTSEKKIRDSICKLLLKYEDLAEPYKSKVSSAIKPHEIYHRGPLPISPELSRILGPTGGEIVDAKNLCLEKCSQ